MGVIFMFLILLLRALRSKFAQFRCNTLECVLIVNESVFSNITKVLLINLKHFARDRYRCTRIRQYFYRHAFSNESFRDRYCFGLRMGFPVGFRLIKKFQLSADAIRKNQSHPNFRCCHLLTTSCPRSVSRSENRACPRSVSHFHSAIGTKKENLSFVSL